MTDSDFGPDLVPGEAARGYASELGWPVAQGTWLTGAGRCSCGEQACPCPGAHPLAASWRLEASTNVGILRELWADRPQAGIVAPTGCRFDALDLPVTPGYEALGRLEEAGRRLGPVSVTADDRMLILVAVGARLGGDAVAGEPWRYGAYDVHCHSEGSYVGLPPTSGARWLYPPVAERGRLLLPHPDEVLGAVLDACLRSQPRDLRLRRRAAGSALH